MREFARFRNSENNECAPWAFCSDSSCGSAVYWRGCHSRRKRMKVGLPSIILHKTSGSTKSSIQHGTCPIIHRRAVATTRTATRLKSSTLTETSTPNVEKMGGTSSFRRKRWNAIGIIRTDEITCAHRRPIPCTRRIPYTASHWEAPHDAPAAPLRAECRRAIGTGHVALDCAALLHNLQYLGIRRNLRSIDTLTEGRRN